MDPAKHESISSTSRPETPVRRQATSAGDCSGGGVVAQCCFRPEVILQRTRSETIHKRVELSTSSYSSRTPTAADAETYDTSLLGTFSSMTVKRKRVDCGVEDAKEVVEEGERTTRYHRRRRHPGGLLPPGKRRNREKRKAAGQQGKAESDRPRKKQWEGVESAETKAATENP